MRRDEDGMQEIAAEIERHLTAQPTAADSIEGISRWWVAPRIGDHSPAAIRRALEDLERRGVVERRPVQDGVVIWGAPRPTSH